MRIAFYIVLKNYIRVFYMAKKLTYKTTGILIVILLGALVFSMLYPFYGGIQEGLGSSLTSTDYKDIQDAMDDYIKEVESPKGACDVAIQDVQKAKPQGNDNVELSQTIPLTISSNKDSKVCSTIDKIDAINPKNTDVIKAINTCYGKKYAATLAMLNKIKVLPAMTNDNAFATTVKNELNAPSVKGMDSSYDKIKEYLDIAKKSS
jgi:hypothetical protein